MRIWTPSTFLICLITLAVVHGRGGRPSISDDNGGGGRPSFGGDNGGSGRPSSIGDNEGGGGTSFGVDNVESGRPSSIGDNEGGGRPSFDGDNGGGGRPSVSGDNGGDGISRPNSGVGNGVGGSSRPSISGGNGGGRGNPIKSTSTLKKAATVGWGVFSAYRKNKAKKKFKKKKPKFHVDLEHGDDEELFNQWDSWREADGFMCRDNTDCNWLDEDLRCENYELSVLVQLRHSINQGWFGGQAMTVVGECHCQRMHQIWDKQELQCSGEKSMYLVGLVPLFLGILLTML